MLTNVFKTVIHVRERERGRERPFDNKTFLQEDSETSLVWDTGVLYLSGTRHMRTVRSNETAYCRGSQCSAKGAKASVWPGLVSSCVNTDGILGCDFACTALLSLIDPGCICSKASTKSLIMS